MDEHILADGERLRLGMRVVDYDAKHGVIIDDNRNAEELRKPHVHGYRATCEAWFDVQCDDGTKSWMDCSRMIAEGGRYDK